MNDHTCSACGGTGYPQDDISAVWKVGDGFVCSVCRGRRRISDRMPVADALADAETLRPWLPDTIHLTGNGFSAVPCIEHMPYWGARDFTTYAGYLAEQDARAAFRAVPGLRGE